jgi:hypothetical protein
VKDLVEEAKIKASPHPRKSSALGKAQERIKTKGAGTEDLFLP